MPWRHQSYKTCKNIYFITSFQLDSVLRPGEVNCLFIFDNNSNSCVLLFNVRFYFFVAWQWKPAGCVDIYISHIFLPPTENTVLKRVSCSYLRLTNCRACLLLGFSVQGCSRGIMQWRSPAHSPCRPLRNLPVSIAKLKLSANSLPIPPQPIRIKIQ